MENCTCLGHSLIVDRKSPIQRAKEPEWTEEEHYMHDFIANNNGVSLTEITEAVNKNRNILPALSLSAINSRLTILSSKDYALYEDTVTRKVQKQKINKKTDEVTIDLVDQKIVLYYINKDN